MFELLLNLLYFGLGLLTGLVAREIRDALPRRR
jgi:hypothetical protein